MQIHQPEEYGMSSECLERINKYMEREIGDNRLPGVLTLVQRRGKVVHHSMHGLMDIEAEKPMQEETLFRIYSMTKPIASIALMMLHEEGYFLLHEPIAKYIPAFAETKVFSHHTVMGPKFVEQDPPITIFHLLTHTAGLSYGFLFDHPLEEMYREMEEKGEIFQHSQTLQSSIERIAQVPLLFQPGTQWRYSYATDVIGYLVEVISGVAFADFLQERIFEPLAMVDTAFHVEEDKLERLMQIYTSEALYNPTIVENTPLVSDVAIPTQSPSGGGGLISSTADYLRFCNMLLNGGELDGVRLISPKTLERMTTNAIPTSHFPLAIGTELYGYGFGLGFRVMMDLGHANGLGSVGEYGWAGIAKTFFMIDPKEELIAMMMTQYLPAADYPLRTMFPSLVYQAIVE
jgi:CubicO group peptidase (beta-lactamase class C family)